MKKLICTLFIFFFASNLIANENGRFFYEGDGNIAITNKNNGKTVKAQYRLADGTYSQSVISQINLVFGMPSETLGEDVSLRLIAILDYLQDKYLNGKTLIIDSGYRSPALNEKLRAQGKTAGQTSYHLDGMAADLVIEKKLTEIIWEDFRQLMYGGVGIYGGGELHVDSGKPRFWTKDTALPKVKEPPQNRNIYLSVDKDIYLPGETMKMFFSGISEFPFGVKTKFKLMKNSDDEKGTFNPLFQGKQSDGECKKINIRKDARLISWTLPEKLGSGRYNIEVTFCDPVTPKMPAILLSREFEIK